MSPQLPRSEWIWVELGLCLWLSALVAPGQPLELAPPSEAPRVFAGRDKAIALLWRNAGNKTENWDLHFRLYQASSAMAMPITDAPWKRLELLPGQTVLESIRLDFPDIKAHTRFLIQWRDATNRAFGTSEVEVFPAGLLRDLSTLAAQEPLGLYDPRDTLKPLLKQAGVTFADLQETASFGGRLAIAGPFSSPREMHKEVAERVKGLAENGAAVVWLVPPPAPNEPLQPSFSLIILPKAAMVLAQSSLVTNLAEDPRAQLNLVALARFALQPETYHFPEFARFLRSQTP